jgi:HECT-domain (ubiquitin-transferase)
MAMERNKCCVQALVDGVQLNCYFTRAFYKHMLNVPLTIADLEATDPDYYKNLQVRVDYLFNLLLFAHLFRSNALTPSSAQF